MRLRSSGTILGITVVAAVLLIQSGRVGKQPVSTVRNVPALQKLQVNQRGQQAPHDRHRAGQVIERADSPAEAASFRRLQEMDENGNIPPDGLLRAKLQADALRVRARARLLSGKQLKDASGIDSSSWTWLGPGNVGGRIRTIVIDPANPSSWFAGSVGGGIWKSGDAGASWLPLNDFMANLAVSSLVIQPGNSSVLYAGTGEGYYNTDAIQGLGIFKSADGGATWSQLPSTANSNFYFVNRLTMSSGGVLLAATRTGISRSTDGGKTFSSSLVVNDPYGVLDIAFNPADGSKAVASGQGGSIWSSTDGGVSWKAAKGLPATGVGRVEIAYAASSPSTVYASADINKGTIYKSTDGGATFSQAGVPGHLNDQGWYANALWVDPTNPKVLVVGGLDLWRSSDGGATWAQISDWTKAPQSAHADHHVIVSVPNFDGATVSQVVFGDDGGIYSASNVYTVGSDATHTSGWTNENHSLGVTQFYSGAGNASTGTIIAGAQDNGTVRYTTAGGRQQYSTMAGGDGGYAAADPQDSRYFYGEYVYLQIYRSSDSGATASYIYSGIGDATKSKNSNFIAPFVLDPNTPNTMLAGGLQLWRTANIKADRPSWTSIKAAGPNKLSAIAIASGNSDICWTGDNGGALYRSGNCTAASPSWTRVDGGGLPQRMVLRIAIDPRNTKSVYVALGGYSFPNLWLTKDDGATWAPVSGGGADSLPAAPIRDLALSPGNSSILYAATEVGVFTSADQGSNWSVPQDGPANVAVDQLFWLGSNLVAVTHGRGMYSTTPSPGANICTAVATGQAPVTAPPDPGSVVTMVRGAPANPAGLPANGTWQHKMKPEGKGEVWTYNFTIPETGPSASVHRAGLTPDSAAQSDGARMVAAPAATTAPPRTGGGEARAAVRPEKPSSPPRMDGAAVRRMVLAPATMKPSQGIAAGSAKIGNFVIPPPKTPDGLSGNVARTPGPPAIGGVIQRRFVVDSDRRQPVSVPAHGWYEVWSDSGWSRVSNAAVPGLRARGVRYRHVVPDPLAGTPAAGSGMTGVPAAAHLAANSPFAAATSNGPAISAFDVRFGQDNNAASVQVYFTLAHPHLDQVTMWLRAGNREVVLWDGRGGEESKVTIDRVLDGLDGSSLATPWTLYVSNADTAPGVLENFQVLTAVGNARPLDQPQASTTLDLIAKRAYLNTAAGAAGADVPSPMIGQQVYLTFDWQMTGASGSTVVPQRALLDGVNYCSFSSSVTNGGWTSWCTTAWTVTSGQHALEWDLDYNNSLAETNKNNNSASFLFAAAGGLDVNALRSYMMTAPGAVGDEVPAPALGQTVYFTVDFQISGANGTVNLAQRAVLDGASFCSFTGTLGNGSWSGWCNTGWTATGGSHTVEWDFDYDQRLPIANRSDNSVSTTFTVMGLNLTALRSYLTDGVGNEIAAPTFGQNLYFTMDWAVVGADNGVNVPQRAVLDGTTFCSFTPAVSTGLWTSSCDSPWAATGGNHTLEWDLDYGNTLLETDKTDNTAVDAFSVAGTQLLAERAYLRTAPGAGSEAGALFSGQTVYLTLDWSVVGADAGVNVPQQAVLDGSVYCSFTPAVLTGAWMSWCNAGWTATPGSHTLEWDLNTDLSVNETSNANDSAVSSFNVAGLDVIGNTASLRTQPAGNGSLVSQPNSGQTVYFTFDWSVVGSTGAIDVPQRALLDGSQYCSFTPSVTAGDWLSWCSTGWVVTPGTHTLQWDLDPGNTLIETNKSNNAAIDVFVTADPNLVAQRAYLRTQAGGLGSEVDPPAVGQTVYLTLDWQFTGTGKTVAVAQRAVLDNSTYCSFTGTAAPGTSWISWCGAGWTVTSGTHTLRWDLDYNNTVEAANANKSASKTFTATSLTASLDVLALRAYLRTDTAQGGNELSQPANGQTVYFYVDWQVTGTGTSVAVSNRAVFDGSVYCSGSANAAPGSSWTSWCNTGWAATPGTHTLRWDLNYDNALPEVTTANNSAATTFSTAASGPTLDIVAVRAYLTNSANGGSEVTAPNVGQSVFFVLDWQINGSGSNVTVSERALLDGSPYCTGHETMNTGSFTSHCGQGWTVTAGTHKLEWDLNYDNSVPETNTNNNTAVDAFTPKDSTPGLDLIALRAYLQTAPGTSGTEVDPPGVGQRLYPSLSWEIVGPSGTLSVAQRALMDGTQLCSCSLPSMVGSSYVSTCSQAWSVTAGSHTLRWDLDYNNAINETNKNNNSTSKTVAPHQ
ncbi:MAG TPA: hypothetical protein VEU96_25855 [Bryobacteraceae bacterium]|nr:hypothetical protein [Bryobacteraceae bacterium]